MGHLHLVAMGRVLKHFVGSLLLAWQRAFRAGFIAGVLAIVVVEIGALILTQQFPPAGITHLVAGALAIAVSFGVAATVVADEIITGIIETVRLLMGEAEAGARQAARIAEREVGDVRGAALRLTGLDTLMNRLAPRDAPNPDLAPDAPRRPTRPRLSTLSTAEIFGALAAPAVASVVLRPTRAAPVAPATPSTPPIAPAPTTIQDAGGVIYTVPDASLAPAGNTPTASVPRPPEFGAAAPTTVPLTPEYPPVPPAYPLTADTLLDERDAISQTPTVPASAATTPPAQAAPATIPLVPDASEPAVSAAPAVAAAGVLASGAELTIPASTPAQSDAPDGAAATLMTAPSSGTLAEPADWRMDQSPTAAPVSWHDPSQGGLELEHDESDSGIQPVDAFGALPPAAGPHAAVPDTRTPFDGQQRAAPTTRPLMPRGSIWDHITNVVAGKHVELYGLDDAPPDAEPPTEEPSPDA